MVVRESLGKVRKSASRTFENAVYSVMRKFGYASAGVGIGEQDPEPPYQRQVPHDWVYRMRRNHPLINNSIEEKVSQTFRRGFTEWEQAYIAKCVECGYEYETVEPFQEQLGEDGQDLEENDLDFSKPRPCPECGEMSPMKTPVPGERDRAQEFWSNANEQGYDDDYLDGKDQNSIGQTVEEVCREVALDIQSFDDGWMVFERTYYTDQDGVIQDWELEELHRGAPEVMRYSFNEERSKLGNERWVCVECRANRENYTPQKKPGKCQDCGNKRTYMAYAKRLKEPRGEPCEWYIRGEFAHGSEYHPSKFYGYSPIITLWEQARTLEQMDNWYNNAYEKRRAPRGALVIRSSNAESVRSWNMEQMEALRDDPQHIPTFMDDTEGNGDPLTWQPLLEEPAAMQNMQMREWFLDRISAKYGVTAVFQSSSPNNSGLSQSMEIIVSNRSAQKLKEVFEDVFLPAILAQLQVDGWTRGIRRIEEEDEAQEAQRQGTELRNAELAEKLGLDAEWTEDDSLDIKPGMTEMEEEGGEQPPDEGEGEEEGGMGGLFGSEEADTPSSQTSTVGGRPYEPNETGGEPRNPAETSTDEPLARADNPLTTESQGARNATYGGDVESTIDLFTYLEDQMEEDATPFLDEEDVVEQADLIYNSQFASIAPAADIIREYAESEDKEFGDLREDHYGKWVRNPNVEKLAQQLYEIHL